MSQPRSIGPDHSDIELPVRVHNECEPLSVGTPGRLEVVAGALGDGSRVIGSDPLNPDIATH